MTPLEKARHDLSNFSAARKPTWPDHVEYIALVEAFVKALLDERLADYQRKPLRFD